MLMHFVLSLVFISFGVRYSLTVAAQYSDEKYKVIAQVGKQEWERRTITELDSALNKWFDSIPDQRTFVLA